MSRVRAWLTVLVALMGSSAWAEPPYFGATGSVSCIKTSANRFIGETNLGNGDCESIDVALNTRWSASDQWAVAGQVLLREAGELDDKHYHLDYLHGEYTMSASGGQEHLLRFGRMKFQLGLFNESRDIAVSSPSIILPQSIYYDRARLLLSGHDGLQYEGNWFGENHTTTFKLGYFFNRDTVTEEDVETYLLGAPRSGEFDSENKGFDFLFEQQFDTLRYRITAGQGSIKYQPGSGDILEAGESTSTTATLSVVFHSSLSHQWTFEHLWGNGESKDYGPFFPDFESNYQGTYLQYDYLLPNTNLFARYDYFRYANDTSDRLQAIGYPEYATYAKDWTFGIRHHLNSHLLISAEYHNIEGVGWLSFVENPNITTTDKHWDLYAIQLAIQF